MASPLIETKLYRPRLRHGVVARPRLGELLSRGSKARMTLVSAPAGFGKTTVVAEWIEAAADGRRSAAWLSLDARDSSPASFWTYVVTALQRAVPGVGADALPLLQSSRTPTEAVLAAVVNELAALTDPLDLILDDYHLADSPEIRAGMTFLLDHLPPQVHLVLCTRADPALPLARLRARGELVELRAADLRFTAGEVAAYLGDSAGLDLAAVDVEALEQRTEGWIAALQLAALSLRGREDVSGFVADFAGDDRYVVDYLVEEVLERQSGDVRDFLLRTSVLNRLHGPLCDAVTGRRDGRAMLEVLDRANLFVVRLDDRRHWYRYHQLFADVLRTHLADERPDEVAALHRRAGQWYADAGEQVPAIGHALEAGDVDRAADLVERAIPALQRDRQEATICGWIKDLPDEVVRVRPVLAVGLVGALMTRGETEGVEDRLNEAEQLLTGGEEGGPAAWSVVADAAALARLPGAIEMYRSALALMRGDPSATVTHAGRAVERAAADDHLVRAAASALSGLADWGRGELDAAHAAYSFAVEGLLRAGYVADVLGCSITLADIRITQGRLADAQRTYERALRLAAEGPGILRGTADVHAGLCEVAWERGDAEAAAGHLRRARELGEPAGLPQHPYRWRVAMAGILDAEGDAGGALDLLAEAERVHTGDLSPNVRPVPATRVRLLLRRGDVEEALDWARAQGLTPDDDLSYVREYEHITLARVMLATAEAGACAYGDAALFLQRLLTAAEAGGRTARTIEILVLQALAHDARGDSPAAADALERALTLAEPHGHVRVFTEDGPRIAAPLTTLAGQRPDWAYPRRLLDAVRHFGGPVGGGTGEPSAAAPYGLVDPLSARESEVLRLLAGDLGGPDIARRLHVSLNTLRTHTRHIYAKLGVTNRRDAVRLAGRLNLISRAPGR
ncbi:LuxR C-terminal-related transcriptional regulator [Streptomyces fructofermentans]|uniref:LuxR C-terminal-related transcriptional regulator n=1 Tax=Streptomyces fructofermentans TaxID=152141 RepID=UPI00167355B9|nr:LuxR C-terminal-related transcriptional regulator [Streptomyces fructofermentans]